jgi:hypothetical protein
MQALVRRIPVSLRAVVLGVVLSASGLAGTATLTGCQDENDPATYVKRLEDPIKKTESVTRLLQFYEDAMTKDKKNRQGPSVKPLLDLIVEPLTKVAASGDLDRRAQGKLLSTLADMHDPRAAEALVKAIAEYKPDDKRPEQYDNDVADVIRSVGEMKLKQAGKPALALFMKLEASWPKASNKQFYLTLHDALMELVEPAWESDLISLIERPVTSLKEVVQLKNEVFWQTTAAKLLGKIRSEKAVRPLIAVVLSPIKADIATTAVTALIKIGKPSIDAAVKVLDGTDADLIKYSKEENIRAAKDRGAEGKALEQAAKIAESAHFGAAAIIVATIGRKEGEKPMLDALARAEAALKSPDDQAKKDAEITRAIIARELPKLPKNPALTKMFQSVYEQTPITISIPPGLPAREQLLEACGMMFDASLTPWVIEDALKLKGEEGDTAPIQDATLGMTMKIALEEHLPLLDKLAAVKVTQPTVTTIGKAYEKELALTKKALKDCSGKGVECWLAKLVEPESQAETTQFQGIKSAYMLGIIGDDKVKDKIVEALPQVTNAAARFVTVSVLDRLSPNGDATLADKLEKIVQKNLDSRDSAKIQADAPLNTIIHRLRARAQQ